MSRPFGFVPEIALNGNYSYTIIMYPTQIKPIVIEYDKIELYVFRDKFAAHVFYYPETETVTSIDAPIVNVKLTEFTHWAIVPKNY